MTGIARLAAYVLAAINYWTPVQNVSDAARHESIAYDIATVAGDPDEASLFKDDIDGYKTAILLAAVAKLESDFAQNVDEGRCRKNQCDHGKAFTIWQMHPGQGLRFDGPFWGYSFAPDRITGDDMVKDRRVAARMALHMMRHSKARAGSLCIYTGERCGKGEHPLADYRLKLAMSYFQKHPYATEESASLVP